MTPLGWFLLLGFILAFLGFGGLVIVRGVMYRRVIRKRLGIGRVKG